MKIIVRLARLGFLIALQEEFSPGNNVDVSTVKGLSYIESIIMEKQDGLANN